MKKVLSSFAAVIVASFLLMTSIYGAYYNLQGWDLIDSGGHLDYDTNGSKYSSYFVQGVNMWENYHSGVIRADTKYTVCDVTLVDIYEVSNVNATTYAVGNIQFNTYQMDKKTASQKKTICAHEIGHCLGIGHLTSDDIMYEKTPLVSSLSSNDKANYDKKTEHSWHKFH